MRKDEANHGCAKIPNPKTQIPSKSQSRTLKKDRERLRSFWDFIFLKIPWDLELGIWDFSAKRLHFD
jgi:hypothetical protein